jgi:ferredoxin
MSLRSPGFLPRNAFQALLDALQRRGYVVLGPQARDGVLKLGEVICTDDLVPGLGDSHAPARYRVTFGGAPRWFDWTIGPQSIKPLVFPPRETLWRAERSQAGPVAFVTLPAAAPRLAVLGARACDLAALALLDRHFLSGPDPDPGYAARRAALLLVGVDCVRSAATCFCLSTGDGPALTEGFDVGLSELDDGFLTWAGTAGGGDIVRDLPLQDATPEQLGAAAAALDRAAAGQRRALPSRTLARALYRSLHHPRWDAVAERCLGCGNCAMVCPTCFCFSQRAETGTGCGATGMRREWETCFSADHSLLHGHPWRDGIAARYRQWVTHKLAGWHSQYGRSGCVGCGRCITWCPAAIDLTEEVAAIAGDGADE